MQTASTLCDGLSSEKKISIAFVHFLKSKSFLLLEDDDDDADDEEEKQEEGERGNLLSALFCKHF